MTLTKIFDIIANDPYLKDYESFFHDRFDEFNTMKKMISGDKSLSEFANAYHFFGCHKTADKWIFREWAPNATAIYLIGDHSNWKADERFAFRKCDTYWELEVENEVLHKGSLYRLLVKWNGGEGERIPAYATRAVQDEATKIFSAQIWTEVSDYQWKHSSPTKRNAFPIIYEAHIGMSSEAPMVSSYKAFKENVLPRIVEAGYNTIQFMAIQEHPYYGSFGYHVSNFFAASSRCGTPEDLKELIDEAHAYGLYVIMDIVHSHSVKNHVEGLALYDGTQYQYFHEGEKGDHPAWDSKCFNYGKHEVLHFLLSNCKYWLTEYRFDGFRFDGVTSMLYWSHGLNKNFMSYGDYFNDDTDIAAGVYIMLANELIHSINKNAITIAEDVSGMPGLAMPIEKGGYGFDYRLAMGIPDFWIKLVKEFSDEQWNVNNIFYELTNRRSDEKTISYVESHDQAIVGDKTMAFRLMDKNMYTAMNNDSKDLIVDRGIALHKMIRLITISTAGAGYLNFMGNEFGHPEWIDFPREGNNWSYQHCRRLWSLVDNGMLRYQKLAAFDKVMIKTIEDGRCWEEAFPRTVFSNESDMVIAYVRNVLLFVFNFHPTNSFTDYDITAPAGEYAIILDTDDKKFGGFSRIDADVHHFTHHTVGGDDVMKLYLPSRCAVVMKMV